MKRIKIALCALALREERMLRFVLGRMGSAGVEYQMVLQDRAHEADLAIVDTSAEASLRVMETLRSRHPALPVIFVSDHGLAGDSRYRLKRASLLVGLHRVLADLVAAELSGESKVSKFPAAGRAQIASKSQPNIQSDVPAFRMDQDLGPFHSVVPLNALVVDDSAVIREQICAALVHCGIRPVQAASVEEAMSRMVAERVDLFLLDIVMPGVDGYELCRRIKRDPYTRATPVILLTSRSSPFDRSRGALAGCDSYLVKPVSAASFYAVVEAALLKRAVDGLGDLIKRGFRTSAIR